IWAMLPEALESKDENIRMGAARSMSSMPENQLLPLFEKALSDTSPVVREVTMQMVCILDSETVISLVEKHMNDTGVAVRMEAAYALQELAPRHRKTRDKDAPEHTVQRAAVLLETMLADKSERVRGVVVSSLGDFPTDHVEEVLIEKAT